MPKVVINVKLPESTSILIRVFEQYAKDNGRKLDVSRLNNKLIFKIKGVAKLTVNEVQPKVKH